MVCAGRGRSVPARTAPAEVRGRVVAGGRHRRVRERPELGLEPGEVTVLDVGTADQLAPAPWLAVQLPVMIPLHAVDQQREYDHHEH
jgi:hypothetical protein